MIRPSLPALLLGALLTSGAYAGDEKGYPLGTLGTLKVTLPAGWTGSTSTGDVPGLTTVTLASPQRRAVLMATPAPTDTSDAALKDAAKLVGTQYAAGSVEKKTVLEEIRGNGVHGYVSSYTDASTDPGEFKFVTAGIVACEKQAFAITILHVKKDGPDVSAARDALKSFSLASRSSTSGESAREKAPDSTDLTSPDGTWKIVIPGKWQFGDKSKSKDGKSSQATGISREAIFISVFFEPAANKSGDGQGLEGAKAARAFYLARMKQNPIPMENIREAESGDVASVEYDQKMGGSVQHHLNAYIANKGVWVDVHVSQIKYDEKRDAARFAAIAKGLKFEPVTAANPAAPPSTPANAPTKPSSP